MSEPTERDVRAVKRILESGDPDRMDTEAENWREVEAMLDGLEKRMKQRIELLGQYVSGGGFAVMSEEHGLLRGHVNDLRFNAQSNGVGWKGLADTLREARPQIRQVATDYESTVVSPDGVVTGSMSKADNAESRANQRAREVMATTDDRFQQVYANTSSEPPPYQGPGDTGKVYRPGTKKGSPVDPATGRYMGDTSNPYNEHYQPPPPPPAPSSPLPPATETGPRVEFPTPTPTPTPGTSFPGGPGIGGGGPVGPGAGPSPGGSANWPFGTPGTGPAGSGTGAGTSPGRATGRASVPRTGTPMGGGAGGAGGAGRPGGRGATPGKPLPGQRPSSVYKGGSGGSGGSAGSGGHGIGRKGRRRDKDERATASDGPYDDELFAVDDDGVDAVIGPEEPVHRINPGPRITPDPSASYATSREFVSPEPATTAPKPSIIEALSLVEPPQSRPEPETTPADPLLPSGLSSLIHRYEADAPPPEDAPIKAVLRRRPRR